MDADLLVIFMFVLITLMIVFPFAAIMHKRNVVHEERKLELQARAEEAKNGNGSSEFRKLEERVRVLERIATDNKQDLALQIESLRDLQEIDDLTAELANRQETTR
jgi:cell division protein FtsL